MTVQYDKKDNELLRLAEENNIPVELSEDINFAEFITRIKEYDVDLFVSMSFNQILEQK